MCDLTDLVITSLQKWGPMISEINQAYSEYHNGRSRSNYDSDESDDGRSSCRSKFKHNSNLSSNSITSKSKNKEEGELDDR